jgi:hypothetical protein
MRYIQPQITGVFSAVSAIKSVKGTGPLELNTHIFSNGAAYQADE